MKDIEDNANIKKDEQSYISTKMQLGQVNTFICRF